MYFTLTAATKRRIIRELRDYWSTHPKYQDIVDNIQGKYSFKERPQFGIIVKTGSASKVQFAPDNFIGTLQSFVALAKVPGYVGLSVEWVREDSLAIQQNGGRFPSLPGVYYCEVTEENEFYIDPLLMVADEAVTMVTASEGVIQNVPYTGSLRLYETPSNKLLRPGVDYTVDADGVTIYFAVPVPSQAHISADYNHVGATTGPWAIRPFTAYNKPIPGCVLAFGKRYQKGDRFAVLVSANREDAYLAYGGKWEMGVDIDIIASDVDSQMEIADQTAMHLWANVRSRLIDQGIDIQDVSMGGESEEIRDETADDYFYNSSISMTIQADWEMHVPLVPKLLSYTETIATLPNELALTPFRDPFFTTGNGFEMVL